TNLTSFTPDDNRRPQTLRAATNLAQSAAAQNLPEATTQATGPCENVTPVASARYIADSDGACMFRAFLAATTRNAHWLSSRICPLPNLVTALENSGLDVEVRLAIAQATHLMLRDLRAADTDDSPLAALGLNAEQLVAMVDLFTRANSLEFADNLYLSTITDSQFLLWETGAVAQQLYNEAQLAGIDIDISLLAVSEHFTNLVSQTIIERLNMPISHSLPVYLEAAGLHYNLRAPLGFFNPRSQAASLNTGLSPQVMAALEDILPRPAVNVEQASSAEQASNAEQAPNAEQAEPDSHNAKSSTKLTKYRAKKHDDTEFFRLLFAGISQDESWLTSSCTKELLQDAISLFSWGAVVEQSATRALGSIFTANGLIELTELGVCTELMPQLARLLIELQQGDFSTALLQQITVQQHFNFWDERRISQAIEQSISPELWEEVNSSFGHAWPAFCQWLGEQVLENFITGLGVFVNAPGRAHLRRMNDGFALLAGRDFFSNSIADFDPDQQLLKNVS
ncbi:MAG: hypothetical protein ACRC9R_07565, partial [Enterovibrio sp.]